MVQDVDHLDTLPLRFNPPDGWRKPHPMFISLYQGVQFPEDWKPYPGAPAIPPRWPWWEENGTSWYRFFRERAPLPARSLGNWFSLAALGLFSIVVSPFALPGWWIAVGGLVGLLFLIIGVRGVVTTVKKQAVVPGDPYEQIRAWSDARRALYLREAYRSHHNGASDDEGLEVFEARQVAMWWGENP